ncbi:MAG: hypothetical protein ACLUD2_08975 [Clostridium sp.]
MSWDTWGREFEQEFCEKYRRKRTRQPGGRSATKLSGDLPEMRARKAGR